jgi:hypothetical protein
VAVPATVANPTTFGACMLNSLHGNEIEPSTVQESPRP